jgi:N-hydroxyarylamine O-acetyltransferase
MLTDDMLADDMLTDDMLTAYLARIAAPRPPALDAGALRDLHRAHLVAVPFENLSIHLGEPISLGEADLIDKIVGRRRGGFCYELNGAFACLLERLGGQVSRVAARVQGGEGGIGPPFDHLALVVRLPDGTGPWLADVGFGSHSTYPLLAEDRTEQEDPGGRFRLTGTPDGDIDVFKDGQLQYRIETRERALDDFVPTCWWQQTSPRSHFTTSVVCSRLTEDGGRISIGGRRLIRTEAGQHTEAGQRTEEDLPDDQAVLAAYRDHFGIDLTSVPEPVLRR